MAYEDEKKKVNDYYTQLKEENYRTLLNSQIQLENARQRASKQMGVGLSASGMNNSGYGSTVQQGLENQYLQRLQNSQQDFNRQNLQLAQNEQNALNDLATKEQNSNAQSIFNIIDSGNYESSEQLYNALAAGKYGSYDAESGAFTWNPDLQLSEADKNNLMAQISLIEQSESKNAEENDRAVFTGQGNVTYDKADGTKGNEDIGKVFANEVGYLQGYINDKTIKKGSYVVLHNGYNDSLYLYIGNDGNIYYSSADEYSKNIDNAYVVYSGGNIRTGESDKDLMDAVKSGDTEEFLKRLKESGTK